MLFLKQYLLFSGFLTCSLISNTNCIAAKTELSKTIIWQDATGQYKITLPAGYKNINRNGNTLQNRFTGPGPDFLLVTLLKTDDRQHACQQIIKLLSHDMNDLIAQGKTHKAEINGNYFNFSYFKGTIRFEKKISRPDSIDDDKLHNSQFREPPFKLYKIERHAIAGIVLLKNTAIGYITLYSPGQTNDWPKVFLNSIYSIR